MYLGSNYIRWCDSCSSPILEKLECPRCGTQTHGLKLSPPCEIKPAFEGEVSVIQSFLDKTCGNNFGHTILPSSPILLNDRAGDSKALDRNYEVIVGGEKIGILRFNISPMRWDFIPLIHLGDYCDNFTKSTLHLRGEFSLSLLNGYDIKGIEVDHSFDGDYVFIRSGPVVALGEVKQQSNNRNTKFSTIKVQSSKIINSRKCKEVPWREVARINEEFLIKQEEECITFLRELRDKFDLPITIAFSGGKDSTAVLLLLKKALKKDFVVVYVDTGIEFPETKNYVTQIIKTLRIMDNFHVVKPRHSFWHYSKIFGPPARDYRWCCKVLKFGPISKYIQNNFPSGTITLTGKRKYESKKRQIESKVEVNRWLPGQILANPIRDWSSLHVWLYLFLNDIPINPAYQLGVNRLSCWICPGLKLAEIYNLKLKHPKFSFKLTSYLRTWRKTYGFTEDWIARGFWRAKNPTKNEKRLFNREDDIKNRLKRSQLTLTKVKGYSLCSNASYTIIIKLNNFPELLKVFLALTPYEPKLLKNSVIFLRLNRGTTQIRSGGTIQIRGDTKESAKRIEKRILKQLLRSSYCVGCGLCLSVCPTGAREIINGRLIVNDGCIKCHLCEEVRCPIDMIL